MAQCEGDARDQPAQHAVADDQVGCLHRHGMMRGGGECQQDAALAEMVRDRHHARAAGHQTGRRAAEQAAHRTEAAGTRNEHRFASAATGCGTGLDDASDGFIAGHQRISHAGEVGHAAGPEQALGPGADAAPGDIDDHVLVAGGGQVERLEGGMPGGAHHDGNCLHAIPSLECQASATAEGVNLI